MNSLTKIILLMEKEGFVTDKKKVNISILNFLETIVTSFTVFMTKSVLSMILKL